VKNIRALAIVVLLGATSRGAAAQELLVPPSTDVQPPVYLPQDLGDLPPGDVLSPADEESLLTPSPADLVDGIASGDSAAGLNGNGFLEPSVRLIDACPALLESTGTWLRRGFWYAEIDALLLNRQFDKRGLTLASETVVGVINPQIPNAPNGFSIGLGNELRIAAGKPGIEGLPRLTLGMFLFRDGDNRDHATEFTWFGAGEWLQEGNLTAVTPDGLQVNDFVDRSNVGIANNPGNPSFDGARSMNFDYLTAMDSFEANYVVRQRMRRDRMALQPDGRWIRQANPSRTLTFLAGMRYLNLHDRLNWAATGIPDTTNNAANTANGQYGVNLDNNLLGTQVGVGMAYEADRWSVSALVKGGGFWNSVDMNSGFSIDGVNGSLGAGQTNADADNLSFMGQVLVQGRWHIRPNMSLRLGAELMVIESLAVAPFQLNFIPGSYPSISQSADNVYMGTSIGWESYW
jgi:hypothetical protein